MESVCFVDLMAICVIAHITWRNESMKKDYQKTVNYSEYEYFFNYDLLKDFEKGRLNSFDTEKTRGLIYGYTFTEGYAKGIIPDAFSMDYWSQKIKKQKPSNCSIIEKYTNLSLSEYLGQGLLIWDAIRSSGEGTIDKPYCVICVEHEYEFLHRHVVFGPIKIIRQRCLPSNIDCIDFESDDCSQSIYFDMSRWFEKVKL